MKKPTIAVTGRKKGSYKRLTGPYDWDLGKVCFEKEEPRKKKQYDNG
jgi:succinate dehydrogenase flavin-adding protein (antitoxin of CptAB toxin-antitoxin module)